jgi:N-acyl-D-amino-acid deacylase
LVQRVDGYRNTFVSGVSTFESGVYTGATPGRLVRASGV